ncbi:hypothetical protein BaRGS_00007131 [Batillaria attramentaria]|uniref:TIR domain-containing protein n=1 Tax=Batillaria attramentaria TaxID=370345 RepID=A0ABD0LQD1_9CAEN
MLSSMALVLLALPLLWTIPATSHSNTCTFETHDDGTHAHCAHKELASLPTTWPSDIVWLDLSYNQLINDALTGLANPQLGQLRHLNLNHNQLQTIANKSFAKLHQLQWLSLASNKLRNLQVDAMDGLEQLIVLDLSNNHLQLDHDTYPHGVFDSLTSLQELYLSQNDDRSDGKYPDVFGSLIHLKTLSIDTFSEEEFGPSFQSQKSLKRLILDDNAKIKKLSNTTFRVFRYSLLEELRIGSPTLSHIEPCAFCDLPNLKILRISSATAPLSSRLLALYGLQFHNMTEIYLSGNSHTSVANLDGSSMRYLKNICLLRLKLPSNKIERVKSSTLRDHESPFFQCLQELDLSGNRIEGDKVVLFAALSIFRNLLSIRSDGQNKYSMDEAGCVLTPGAQCKSVVTPTDVPLTIQIHLAPSLQNINLAAGIHEIGAMPDVIKVVPEDTVKTLIMSYTKLSNCLTSEFRLTALEVLDLSGNNCYNLSTTIFDNLPVLRELRLSNLNLNPEFFRTHARRLFQNLLLLLTLDLSLNNLVHVDLHMLRSQRHLKELNMAGNRLQSLPLDLTLHEELEMIDLTNNMLTTLEQHERQVLDKLAGKHNLTLHLGGNPLLCACSNLDFVRWLWSTEVQLDGDGRDSRTFTCVTESGEVSDTHSVMVQYDTHWRRCVGQQVLGVTTAAFLLLLLALVIVYVVSRSWTHLRYVWKVMQQLRLPQRENFRRDAYVGYADADWEFACVTLPACLQERHGVRLLLRDFEEVPGSIRAENIVQHIDDSWKVVLLVTRAFATDEWLCGFTVQQAQRSIMDTMPDRVLVVFMEDPARLPPMASLERLLRMVPEKNVVHMRRDTPQDYPVWDRLARDILDRKRRDEY